MGCHAEYKCMPEDGAVLRVHARKRAPGAGPIPLFDHSAALPAWIASRRTTDKHQGEEQAMNKTETVAMMAAAMYAAGPLRQTSVNPEEIYDRIAAMAWSLYDAVEKESANRHSRR